MCLTGIIEFKDGMISLSDIGTEIANNLLKIKSQGEPVEEKKTVYINPDFSIIIPDDDIPSQPLYHLLTHTKIIKKDVILHVIIDKSSIINAHKRGMSIENFMDILERYSINEIPQNLDFIVTEWSSQALTVKISRDILIKASNSSFLDDIILMGPKNVKIERINAKYAIIQKKYIDEIIKFAKKNDAIIALFEEEESDFDDF